MPTHSTYTALRCGRKTENLEKIHADGETVYIPHRQGPSWESIFLNQCYNQTMLKEMMLFQGLAEFKYNLFKRFLNRLYLNLFINSLQVWVPIWAPRWICQSALLNLQWEEREEFGTQEIKWISILPMCMYSARYCGKHRNEVNKSAFKECSIFRGIR